MIRKEQLYEQILEQIDLTKETDDEELQELIRTVLDEAADEEYIPLSDKIRIGRELFNSFRKLDVLQELLEDDSITEIMVNGIDHIFYEKEGRILSSELLYVLAQLMQNQLVSLQSKKILSSKNVRKTRRLLLLPPRKASALHLYITPSIRHNRLSEEHRNEVP